MNKVFGFIVFPIASTLRIDEFPTAWVLEAQISRTLSSIECPCHLFNFSFVTSFKLMDVLS